MKHILKNLILLLLFFVIWGIFGCSDSVIEQPEGKLSSVKEITSFGFKATENDALSNDLIASINGTAITAIVSYGTLITSLVPAFTIMGISLEVDSQEQISGYTAHNFTNDVIYTVTAADGSTQDYTVSVTAGSSSNANLSGISLTSGALIPAFDPSVTSYNVYVDNAVTSITVTGTSEESNAAAGGDSGNPLTLSEGSNAIVLDVTAEDGTTTKAYTVIVEWKDYTSTNIGTLKYIPAGSFNRGSSSDVSIISTVFRMSRYEITRQQFYDIMGVDPSDTGSSSDPTAASGLTNITDPAQRVNWYHAIAFCNKLSIAEGLDPVYSVIGITDWANLAYASIPNGGDTNYWEGAVCDWSADGYRLPTEMEWLWAAMGAQNAYGLSYAGSEMGGGGIIDDVWFNLTSDPDVDGTHTTQSVGTRITNELGLYDMSGNVYEWCWDWEAYTFPEGTLTDYRGPVAGENRILHGGSWNSDDNSCTIANRDFFSRAYAANNEMGFRVVRK